MAPSSDDWGSLAGDVRWPKLLASSSMLPPSKRTWQHVWKISKLIKAYWIIPMLNSGQERGVSSGHDFNISGDNIQGVNSVILRGGGITFLHFSWMVTIWARWLVWTPHILWSTRGGGKKGGEKGQRRIKAWNSFYDLTQYVETSQWIVHNSASSFLTNCLNENQQKNSRGSVHLFWELGVQIKNRKSDFSFPTESFPGLQIIPYSEHFDVGGGESSDWRSSDTLGTRKASLQCESSDGW